MTDSRQSEYRPGSNSKKNEIRRLTDSRQAKYTALPPSSWRRETQLPGVGEPDLQAAVESWRLRGAGETGLPSRRGNGRGDDGPRSILTAHSGESRSRIRNHALDRPRPSLTMCKRLYPAPRPRCARTSPVVRHPVRSSWRRIAPVLCWDTESEWSDGGREST